MLEILGLYAIFFSLGAVFCLPLVILMVCLLIPEPPSVKRW